MAQQDLWGHPGWPCRSLRSPWVGSTDVTPPAHGEGPQREKEGRGGTWQASPPQQALSQAVGAAGAGWLGPEELAGLSDGHQVPADEDVKAKSGSGLRWKCSMGGLSWGGCMLLTAPGPRPGVCHRRCTSLGQIAACSTGAAAQRPAGTPGTARGPMGGRHNMGRVRQMVWMGWTGQDGTAWEGMGQYRRG